MIRVRLSQTDLERLRFAYSPLAEVAESLYVLHCGQIPDLHRAWWEKIRTHLPQVDMKVLSAIVPAPRPHVASFLLTGASGPSTSIDDQLDMVADITPERLRADLEVVWRGDLPRQTRQLLEHDGAPRIAEALRQYWGSRSGRTGHRSALSWTPTSPIVPDASLRAASRRYSATCIPSLNGPSTRSPFKAAPPAPSTI